MIIIMTPEVFFNTVRDAIAQDFLRTAHSGVLEHQEHHHDGSISTFRLIPSARHVAFTLDPTSKQNPFPILAPGLNARNDLTIVCLDSHGRPLIFIVECKNSSSAGNAQHQIECGMAFCKYLFSLLRFGHGQIVEPRLFGVVAYRPKSLPKGRTRPCFIEQGQNSILRADWAVDVDLPLSELIRAAAGS